MGQALHSKLKTVHETWRSTRHDAALVDEVAVLADPFGKQRSDEANTRPLAREDLERIGFEYVTG